ncbi:hypothetical protein ACFLS0_04035 [Candidatus Bipolaricaulota bacterium]
MEKAAVVMGVGVATIRQWIDKGQLEIVRMNGKIRVLTSFIEDRMGEMTPSRSNQEFQP